MHVFKKYLLMLALDSGILELPGGEGDGGKDP